MNGYKHIYIGLCLFFSAFSGFAQMDEFVTQQKGSAEGYILYAPLNSKNTFLIDKCGTQVHRWVSKFNPAQSVYLLPDGSLLRPCNDTILRGIPCIGGIIERFDWESNLLWSYSISNRLERQHHDVYPMPNGNVLALVYRKKTNLEATAAGRKASESDPYLMDETIIEIKPVGRDSGIIVWKWDAWDHLVQDLDSKLLNYGQVAQNPQLININYAPTPGQDWLHFNALSYNPDLDQIIVSIHELNEIFIIDHSTTTTEAASHKGGKRGKGGDLLYRWGNPEAYKTGTAKDRQLFKQHNPYWIEKGKKDAGKIMIFNNGNGRPGLEYSSVVIIDPPMDKKGNYILKPGKMAGPVKPLWTYVAPDSGCFYSDNVSNAQRLANGNTLICIGHYSKFFEIDAGKKMVWAYCRRGLKSVNEPSQRNVQTFRCTFYEPDYGAFTGRKITPCAPVEINPGNYPCFSK